jgi:hypothetical protein
MLIDDKYAATGARVRALGLARPAVLDVGCRDCVLRGHLPTDCTYHGVDLSQNRLGTVDTVLDVQRGLPMGDRSFDAVAALDVAEHVDDLERGLAEMLRVARRLLIVALPNMAHLFFRARFLATGRLGDKYDLHPGAGADRHRWLTVLPQTDAFMRAFASGFGADLEVARIAGDGRRKRLGARLARRARLDPALWAWSSLYVLDRREG